MSLCALVITRAKSLKIARFAFEIAKHAERKKVTAVHKANIMWEGDMVSSPTIFFFVVEGNWAMACSSNAVARSPLNILKSSSKRWLWTIRVCNWSIVPLSSMWWSCPISTGTSFLTFVPDWSGDQDSSPDRTTAIITPSSSKERETPDWASPARTSPIHRAFSSLRPTWSNT